MLSTEKNSRQLESYKDFPITTICRADLEQAGFDSTNVDDYTMKELASKMANAYCDMGFWEDLDVLADYLKIERREKSAML